MTTGAAKRVFLDTNVLVYATVAEAPFHEIALQAIAAQTQAGAELWINRQVLREYLTVLTRTQIFANPIPIATVIAAVRVFEQRFNVAEDNAEVTERLLALLAQIPSGGKQAHDAYIVATMQTHDIQQLLTDNAEDFARFAQFIAVLPLVPPNVAP